MLNGSKKDLFSSNEQLINLLIMQAFSRFHHDLSHRQMFSDLMPYTPLRIIV